MEKNFSKSLWGYMEKEVDQKIDSIEANFKNILNNYEIKESKLIKDNLELENELKNLYIKVEEYRSLKNVLLNNLYESHLNSVNLIYESETKLDNMMKYKNKIIKDLENKNEDINLEINNLITHIRSSMDSLEEIL